MLIVDFDNLITNTDSVMRSITKFINIKFNNILITPSIDGKSIVKKDNPIIGKVNDDPLSKFNDKELKLASHIYSKIVSDSFLQYRISFFINFTFIFLRRIFQKNKKY